MRNALHIILGAVIMFVIGWLTDFSEYTTEGKYIGVPVASLIIGTFIGFCWEGYWDNKYKGTFDKNDIIRTAIGFLIGGLIATL